MTMRFAGPCSALALVALVAFAEPAAKAGTGWSPTMDALRKAWGLVPADAARPDLWESRKLSTGPQRLLLRADSSQGGTVKSVEWLAEVGVRAQDIADESFWSILDATSGFAEWTETDPDVLPKSFLKALGATASQGFVCRSCNPRLVGATFARHGATRLRIAALSEPAAPIAVGLASGVTDNGLRSLAAQQKLSIDVANPCLDKSRICTMEMSADGGRKWIFRRRDGNSPWSRLEASYQAGAWWSSEWDWDSLRIQSPREFKSVVGDWIGSEADVAASKLLSPVESVLGFTVSHWKARELPGLRVRQVSDSVAKLPGPPSSLVLARTERLDFRIDAFGRRIVSIGEPLP
jgi:hypothetical protein